jgi:hypothetical protein
VRTIATLILLLIMSGCGQPFWRPRPASSEPFPEPASTAIQALSIERSPCMDTSCDAYRYTYYRDGRAVHDSLSPVDAQLLQQATAALDSATFAALTIAVLDRGFFRMQPWYSTGTTDVRQVTVRAVLLDTVKTVIEEESVGPAALHEIQLLLDSVGHQLPWHAVRRSD